MRAWILAPIVVVTVLGIGPGAYAARTQPSVDAAASLYAAAAYDDALAMLDTLSAGALGPSERTAVDHYRMLCLLALGRSDEAERVVAALLAVNPTYRLNADETSPRVMKVFLDARRRALPGVARQRYEQGRTLHADRAYAAAVTEFAVVRTLLADPDLVAGDPSLADLGQLAAGFEDLSRAAIAVEEAKAAAANAAASAAIAAEAEEKARQAEREERARAAATPPPPPADGVYGVDDPTVVPPVGLRQDLRWTGTTPRPPEGTPLGQVQFVVDESGAVRDAVVIVSVSGFYDKALLESVATWRYRPATKAGRPVKYRRVVAVMSR